jgi:hypothetical protein
MNYFVDEGDRVYVTLDGVAEAEPATVDYIAICPTFTLGQITHLQGMIVAINEASNPELRTEEYLRAVYETAFVGWRLTGPDGQAIPFDRARVRQFNSQNPLFIAAGNEVTRRNPTLTRRR